ncbi:IctB family putative bicarbonate transporter [Lyngbya confervoides]|uniref:IctB family putative bicarbonate transporter n=1 Tax=Lyngbya confervoides BDU141951 TaxID=1574623 RepID=A0ABD4T6S7_9CYAN|nr:IctB family putative bicarbonate transporter [Lyngbya confervoides]MCM1984161.1 IctB family putative bicarbonate transporter [Lyngbya confervoides BDU141951]
MNLWQSITLAQFPAQTWAKHSFLLRGIGLLNAWRSQSLLVPWLEPMALLVVSAMFIVAPLVSNTYTGLLALGCGALWLVLTLADDRPMGQRFIPAHLLLMAYWFVACLATAQSPVKGAAAVGLVKLTLYLLAFLLMERLMRFPQWRSVLTTVYLLTALFVTVYGIRQYLFGAEALATWVDPTSPTADQTRVYSYLGNPNLLAGYLLPTIPLGLAVLVRWRGWLPKLLAATMTALNLICLYGTGSRGGWIGAALAVFVMGILILYWYLPLLPPLWRVSVFPMFIGTLVTMIVLGLLFSSAFRDRALSVFAGREDSSNNFRINVWNSVGEMIRDRPWLGIGPGNSAFNRIYPLYQRPNYSALGAYSVYLELMVEVGLIGFSLFFWFLLTLVSRALTRLHQIREQQDSSVFLLVGALAAMAGMLVHGFVDTVWYRPEVATVWWLLVAVVFSYGTQGSQQAAQVPNSGGLQDVSEAS